ncbi:MAG: hypothetical protein K2I14_00275, partial [Eubacterium sp.]|nr:hypothetical protein [Eubacterium sp.]
YIEIDDGNTFSYVNNESNIEKFLNQFSEIKTSKSPVLDRNFNRGSNVITFYHNDSYISFNFDTDCRQVWIDNNLKPSEVYTVEKPENVFSLLESAKNNSNINQNYKQYAYMNSKNEPVPPKVTLFEENKTFSFFYSAYSSYLAKGTYEIENNKLILKTSDKEFIYAFDISENGIIFDKKHSTALPEYRYSENTEDTDTPVPDRAFFELTNG